MTSEQTLRVTVAALLHATGENQTVLAAGLGLTQGQVSRKQSGGASWSLTDIDRLSSHYGIPVPDLLAGPSHAVDQLRRDRRAAVLGGRQTVIAV